MPGLSELEKAQPGQLDITYREIDGGAQLIYETNEATLVAALHKWFDAQLSDHGRDAVEAYGKNGIEAHEPD